VVDYNLAIMNLQYVRGTLLNDMHVSLAEGPWTEAAHYGAAKQSRRFRDAARNYVLAPAAVGQRIDDQRLVRLPPLRGG
jgi:hypothetical protein